MAAPPPLITVGDVVDALGVTPLDTDTAWLAACTAAAVAFVERLPVAQTDHEETRADARLGCVMLAAHLFHRRGTGAVAPDWDGAVAIPPALDPVITRLLRIGGHATGVVA